MTPFAAIIVLAQVSGTGALQDTLRALEEGAEVSVSRTVGAEAARALERYQEMTAAQVGLHLRAALEGGAHRELGAVAPRLLADDGHALEPTLRALADVEEAHDRRAVLARVPAATATRHRLLDAWADDDEAVARGAVLVCAPACAPAAAADLLRRVATELPARAPWVLEGLAGAPPSRELLDALVDVEGNLPANVAAALGPVLASLVDRDLTLAEPLVEALSRAPTLALLGASAAVPPALWDRAAEQVMALVRGMADDAAALRGPEVQLLSAAIAAGGELRLPELLFELPRLLEPRMPQAVRVSALEALGAMGAREAATIDLLIGHLSEPEPLATTAYQGLLRRSRVKMPQRPSVWQEWRARTKLVEMTPEEHVERLRAERDALYDARRVAVRRAARDE